MLDLGFLGHGEVEGVFCVFEKVVSQSVTVN